MSNCDTQQGWFYMVLGIKREALCYRCNRCNIFSMLGDGPQQRVWCCNQFKKPPKAGFWGAVEIPRQPYIPSRGLTVMPSSDFEITD